MQRTFLRIARRACVAAALSLAALATATAQVQPQAPQRLPEIQLSAGFQNINVEVARRPDERAIGLMHRKALAPNAGMLFVFEQKAPQCFWMRNTLVPLSIAFLDDNGAIVNIDDMQPLTETSHCSSKPVRFVLEMNKGWFAQRGLQAGDRLRGGPFGR